MRMLLPLVAVMGLIVALGGCAQVDDGSAKFNAAHPEYNHRPDYFDHDPGYDQSPQHFSYFGTEDDQQGN
jgi:hypothetical protein